jgi:tetratricopeptide (TPR) repeat protein
MAHRVSRQMLTAGGADEQVADNGPNGHSVFTWTLLQGLEGRADLNNDGFITASELAAYIGPAVSTLGKQTPAFGSLVGSEGGEFIFDPRQDTEYLSELSVQLDKEAIDLNNQLDQIRKQIAEKRLRNENLQKELVLALANSDQDKSAHENVPQKPVTFAKYMETGDALFKERKYPEALAEFIAAAKTNVSSPLAANNIGYVYFKMGRYEDAIQWFEKTIALDPGRAIAYANLGDAYSNIGRKTEAKNAYINYLKLSPNSKIADEIQKRLSALQ